MRFGHFEIHPAKRALVVDGKTAAVGARAFDLLLALAERRERLVTKQELMDIVWPGVVVEEHNIAAQMSTLRRLLGSDVISTIAGRGYQFVATPSAPYQQHPTRAAPTHHNLSDPRTRFIGREAALADLARLVPQSRLLTLTGIGGCGKTRLALQFARRQLEAFADGVWFVDLSPLKDATRVVAACASALGLSEESDTPLIERLLAQL
ncbi:MAG: winged helix-turn-helix domain-containing protein, partial [Burkholderiaceae bacterium]